MLKIKNLCAQLDSQIILNGLNLTVKAGELHVIMGPNGSGKSTLANVLAGLGDYKISGQVVFNGRDLLKILPENRARAGIFLGFQYPVEIPGVAMGNLLKAALDEQRKYNDLPPLSAAAVFDLINRTAREFDLGPEFIQRAVNAGFSGGEKKRAELLQMAVLEPKLAILDEIDSGLDVDALKIMIRGIKKMRDPARSFILITHYQKVLDYIQPDKVHVMINGKIVKSGGLDLAGKIEQQGYDWLKKNCQK